jgi:hypothetical protein
MAGGWRSVSAIWLAVLIAGWQQLNSRMSESSVLGAASASGAAASSSDCGVATAIRSSRWRATARCAPGRAACGPRRRPASREGCRLAVGRPLHRGGEQGFLGGILAQVELAVSVPADQRAEDLRRELTLLFGRLCIWERTIIAETREMNLKSC